MSCSNCFSNCAGNIIPDKCVKYTGDDIDTLGICAGTSLYEVETIIFDKLTALTYGTNITLDNTIGCSFLSNILAGKTKSLFNITQMLIDGECSLRGMVQDIQDSISSSASFDVACLGISTDSTKDEILQASVTKICALNTLVNTINTTYVKNSDVCTLVTQCIAASASTQEYTKMPKYVALPYHGPLSVFDSVGKGISSKGYDKVYMCIGQTVNGFVLPDYRGRSPMGANTNIPTGGIDANVNPALPGNASYSVTNNTKKGNYTHTISTTEQPAHTHPTGGQTITIKIPGQRGGDNSDHSNTTAFAFGDKAATEISFNGTLSVNTLIPASVTGSTGGGQSHNNLAPIVGSVFIMFVP